MKSYQFTTEKDFAKFQETLSAKIRNGFVIIERNDKLPYVVLSKAKKQMDPSFHLALVFITLGLWSIVWFYILIKLSGNKEILVALDEDGNVFEEKCLSK
ncbi:hypothetical protein [Flavobacterium sp. CF136]|jgi:Na+-transporting NADH:ubiquinone oxidoreductase subunit NqrC|uniref:hypothetical protein n=1 Tax=Flavobacterium sp. (strain CF136) TaxID=1144313 RepID=UPI000271B083|nr:hypothetical protein [Flavobacterium sp. CF136]EJL62349.1 hypothetical protein PMI10_02888 [Flavobacterium sp. CF136]